MPSQQDGEYYVGAITDSVSGLKDELKAILVNKFRDFRIEALQEADGKAFGRTNLSAERKRSERSYYGELFNPRIAWFMCFYAADGLQGNVFRNSGENPPTASKTLDESLNSHDERMIRDGDLIALSSGYGPVSKEDWKLPRLKEGNFSSESAERRFHLSNLYLSADHRGAKSNDNEKLFVRLCLASFEFFEKYAYKHATEFPVWLRLRGTVAPDAPGTKLMDIYKSWNYHFLSWIPQVTAMILNGGRPERWPEVDENPAFYSHCVFPAFEKLCRIEEDGTVYVLTGDEVEVNDWRKKAKL